MMKKTQKWIKTSKTFGIIFLFVIFITACQSKSKVHNEEYLLDRFHDCESRIIDFGDINCYRYHIQIAQMKNEDQDLLFPIFLMANKYDYGQAYFDFFRIFLKYYVDGDLSRFYEIDLKSQKLLMQYLNIAIEKNIKKANVYRKYLVENVPKTNPFPLTKKEYSNTFVNKVYYEGDTLAYLGEMRWYYYELIPERFFFWSLFMANRYDYGPAYFDVFRSIYYVSNGKQKNKIDKKTEKFALDYLSIAISKNVVEAMQYKDLIQKK